MKKTNYPQTVVAKSFVLVDDNGDKRAQLAFDEEGSPALTFYDRLGKLRATIGLIDPEGLPVLMMLDRNEQVGAALSVDEHGKTHLDLGEHDEAPEHEQHQNEKERRNGAADGHRHDQDDGDGTLISIAWRN